MSRQSSTGPSRRRSAAATTTSRKGAPGRGRRWLRRLLWTALAVGVLGLAVVGISYAVIQPPKPNDIATAQASVIYYADGQTELQRISEINRESVNIGDLPAHVGQTMLAAEDREFYTQNGVSPKGMARAVWVAIKGGAATQGGSTITQQYVKNYFLTSDRTLTRKYKEILLSIKIDQQQSKQQILENYLNTIYYGRGAYGIETAAQAYYGKAAKDLTVEEAAVLASVIRGPSLYDPQLGPEQLKNLQTRWAYVLDGMVSQGWLDQGTRAAMQFPMPVEWKPRSASGTNGYLVQLIKAELRSKLQLTDADIDRGGLQIVSTIDKARQDAAVAAVNDVMPADAPDLKVGLASVVPGDGAVTALYGGADYATVQFNSATDAKMQAGSTFKPFTLIAALKSGKTNLRNTYSGASPQYFDEFKDPASDKAFNQQGGVRNFGNTGFGMLDLASATANSVNTVYAQLNILATPKATSEVAKAAGVQSEVPANYGNVFGTASVHVLEMANAYATIAAQGKAATPYFVKAAKSPDGAFDYTAKPEVTTAFDADLMADTTFAMQAVVQRGSGKTASSIGRPLAGKTGTTSDNKAAWFNGFAPQLATAVGIYRPGPNGEELEMKNVAGLREVTGATLPVSIWTAYMKVALQGLDVVQFPKPAYVNKNAAPTRAPTPAPSVQPSSEAPTPTPEPTPSQAPRPTPTPTPNPTGNGNGNGNGNSPSPSIVISPSPAPSP
jgi:membrane peptidoglycan carboxypeptidase